VRNLLPFVLLISVVMLAGCPKKGAESTAVPFVSDPKWEIVSSIGYGYGNHNHFVTERTKAPGGWVYRTYGSYDHDSSMCYVPTPEDMEGLWEAGAFEKHEPKKAT